MRVLATIPVFNEAEFLPLQITYLREQGVMIHVIDNESTDDSRAICDELGVTVTPLDTGGAFDLTAIQKERTRIACGYEHDWHLYGDADERNLFSDGIVGACLADEAEGANVIPVAIYSLHYTGEMRDPDPRRGFPYGVPRYIAAQGITRLHRCGPARYFGGNAATAQVGMGARAAAELWCLHARGGTAESQMGSRNAEVICRTYHSGLWRGR